jgi:Flp pilus assembly protein TadB
VAVAAVVVVGRLEPAAAVRRRERVVADLPVALDLLAACLTAGSPLPDATAAVARAVGGPLGTDLDAVVAVLRLGGPPAAAWSTLATPELAGVARTLARAAETGASLATAIAEAAREQREQAQFAAEERARGAGVYAVAPLGLCFLPAFVLVGVVPVVAGLLGTVLP